MTNVFIVLSEDDHVQSVWSSYSNAAEAIGRMVEDEENYYYGDEDALYIKGYKVDED